MRLESVTAVRPNRRCTQSAAAPARRPSFSEISTRHPFTPCSRFVQTSGVGLVQRASAMAYTFDSLGYAKRLRDRGVPQEQAEAHAEAARDFIMAELVTKT